MDTALKRQAGVGQQCFYLLQTDEPQVVLQVHVVLELRYPDNSLKGAKSFDCLLENA